MKAIRLQIEQEKLLHLKAKTNAMPNSHARGNSLTLNQRLKGYAPSQAEVEQLRRSLSERMAVMSLNDRRALERMLAHRRENECDDIELLEAELEKHYAARAKRKEAGRRAYDDCQFTGEEMLSRMRAGKK